MPVNDFESPFEQIVLTQAAISATHMLRDWFQQKEKARQEPDDHKRVQKLIALDPDRGASHREVVENLFAAFKADHQSIFKYASRYNKRREDRVFQIDQLLPGQEENLKKIFAAFVIECYEKDGSRKPMNVDQAAVAMQKLYENLKTSNHAAAPYPVPLRYKRFPASIILTQLGGSEKWKDINNGKGLNFNRGSKPRPDEDLGERFRKAFEGELDAAREREFKTSNFIDHYESHIDIAGYRFPCLRFGWGQTNIITDTGYCVDLTEDRVRELTRKLKQDKGGRVSSCTIDFTPPVEKEDAPATKHLSSHIDTEFYPKEQSPRQQEWAQNARKSLEKLKRKLTKIKDHDKVDGRDVTSGKAVLVSMDIDLMTGLSLKDTKTPGGEVIKSEVTRLTAFAKAHAKEVRHSMPEDIGTMSDLLSLFPKPSKVEDYAKVIDEKFNKLRLIAIREDNTDIVELIDAARPQVKIIAPRIMRAVEKHFSHKIIEERPGKGGAPSVKEEVLVPIKTQAQLLHNAHGDVERKHHKKAQFLMTMGGPAAGKSSAEVIANEECGKDNYVIAGLDHVRSMFDRQAINLATDNHNYDYKNVEQAGKIVRAMVLERAREQGYHVLLDSSGIPYEGRFSQIVAGFKHNPHEYKTNVLGFDRTLYVNDPAVREQLFAQRKAPKDVLGQQGIRLGRELRAMPVKMIANNYAAMPEALLQASQDLNVDRFWLIDTNPKKVKAGNTVALRPDAASDNDIHPYILSFTAEVSALQLDQLDGLKGAELQKAIAAMQETDDGTGNKKISKALNHPALKPDTGHAERWDFKVVNKTPDGRYRIEVITDSKRYLSTMEKGLFNRGANGPEDLFRLTKLMSFDVEGLFATSNHTLKIQPEREVAVDDLAQIPHATNHSLAARNERCLRIPDNEAITFLPVASGYTGTGKAG